jgi:hypothetical protein
MHTMPSRALLDFTARTEKRKLHRGTLIFFLKFFDSAKKDNRTRRSIF